MHGEEEPAEALLFMLDGGGRNGPHPFSLRRKWQSMPNGQINVLTVLIIGGIINEGDRTVKVTKVYKTNSPPFREGSLVAAFRTAWLRSLEYFGPVERCNDVPAAAGDDDLFMHRVQGWP